jgi:hypothetical protein
LFVGGLRALPLLSLRPLVMAGVAQHSRYRGDPAGAPAGDHFRRMHDPTAGGRYQSTMWQPLGRRILDLPA